MRRSLADDFAAAVLPPKGWTESRFENAHGTQLRYGHAPAADPVNSRGTIVMTHGYGEHIELYYHAIRFYQQRGFNVWMMEWQGHGKSETADPVCDDCGEKDQTRGMLTHRNDLEFFTKNVVQRDPAKPVIMSTNSMGGHIGLLALENDPDLFDGAIMSTPMFDIYRLGAPPVARPLFRLIFNALAATPWGDRPLPALDALGGAGNNITEPPTDDVNFRRQWNDTARRKYAEIQTERPSPAWVSSAYDTIVPSLKDSFLSAVKTPMLVGSAGRDNLVDNAAIMRVARHTDTEVVALPSAEHSLWFEGNGNYESWTSHIDSFLDRIAPAQKAQQEPLIAARATAGLAA